MRQVVESAGRSLVVLSGGSKIDDDKLLAADPLHHGGGRLGRDLRPQRLAARVERGRSRSSSRSRRSCSRTSRASRSRARRGRARVGRGVWKARPMFGSGACPGSGRSPFCWSSRSRYLAVRRGRRGRGGEPEQGRGRRAHRARSPSVVDGDTSHADRRRRGRERALHRHRHAGGGSAASASSASGSEASERNHELVDGERVRLVVRRRGARPLRAPARLRLRGRRVHQRRAGRGGYARDAGDRAQHGQGGRASGRLERQAANAGRGLWDAC